MCIHCWLILWLLCFYLQIPGRSRKVPRHLGWNPAMAGTWSPPVAAWPEKERPGCHCLKVEHPLGVDQMLTFVSPNSGWFWFVEFDMLILMCFSKNHGRYRLMGSNTAILRDWMMTQIVLSLVDHFLRLHPLRYDMGWSCQLTSWYCWDWLLNDEPVLQRTSNMRPGITEASWDAMAMGQYQFQTRRHAMPCGSI